MLLPVPAFHQGTNHSLGLAVGLGSAYAGTPLRNLGVQASRHKRVRGRRAHPFFPDIRVPTLDGIGTFFQDLLQKRRGRQLGFVRQNIGKQFPREIINRDKQVFFVLRACLALQHRQLPGIGVEHLARIVFIVAFRVLSQPLFNRAFYFRQAFYAIFEAPKPVICTVMHLKISLSTALEDFVYSGPTHVVRRRQIRDSATVLVIRLINLFALLRRQAGLFMNIHTTSVGYSLRWDQSVNNARFSNT